MASALCSSIKAIFIRGRNILFQMLSGHMYKNIPYMNMTRMHFGLIKRKFYKFWLWTQICSVWNLGDSLLGDIGSFSFFPNIAIAYWTFLYRSLFCLIWGIQLILYTSYNYFLSHYIIVLFKSHRNCKNKHYLVLNMIST